MGCMLQRDRPRTQPGGQGRGLDLRRGVGSPPRGGILTARCTEGGGSKLWNRPVPGPACCLCLVGTEIEGIKPPGDRGRRARPGRSVAASTRNLCDLRGGIAVLAPNVLQRQLFRAGQSPAVARLGATYPAPRVSQGESGRHRRPVRRMGGVGQISETLRFADRPLASQTCAQVSQRKFPPRSNKTRF